MPRDEESILGDLPGDLRQLIFEAEETLTKKDYVKAKFSYQKMADKYPDYVDGWYGLTRVYIMMQDFENAAKCYSFTLDVAPDFDPNPSLKVLLINSPSLAPGFIKALAQHEFFEQGLKFLEAVEATDPDFDLKVDLLQLKDDLTKLYADKKALLDLNEKKKKQKEAAMWGLTLLVIAGVIIGVSVWGYLFFKRSAARVAFGQGKNNYIIAEQKYAEAVKFDKSISESLTHYHEAQRFFEESLNARQDEYMSWYMLGVTYLKLRDIEFSQRTRSGRFNEDYAAKLLSLSKAAQENALKYEPDFPESHYELARVYFEMLDKKNALDQCDQAINYAKKVYSDDQFKLDQITKQCRILKANINKNL